MKKRAIVLAILGCTSLFAMAQTSGEKESFETMKNAANLYFLNGDFNAAKAQYEGIFKLFGQYEEFTKEVRFDYEKCLKELDKIAVAKKENERLTFSEPFINFPYTNDSHNIIIQAGQGGSGKWDIESCPNWCQLSRDGNLLTVEVDDNPDPTLRAGEVTIKITVSGKVITRGLPVLQVARPLEERSVRFITEPGAAQIYVGNDPIPRSTPLTITLKEGEIPIHIMKQDYFSIDTFITVSVDDDPKVTKEYSFDLVPLFGMVKLNLNAVSGRLDDKNPKIYIGDRLISLDGYFGRSGLKDIHSPGTIVNRFEVYQNKNQDFIIPLEPASYSMTVVADGFEDYIYSFSVHEGETVPLDIMMTPKRGTIRFINGANAEGVLIKDGSTPIGTLTDQLEIQLIADDHKLSFEKEHYFSENPYYSIHLNPGEVTEYVVYMSPLAYINVFSDPTGAEVIVNNLSEGLHTPVINKAVPLGQNSITIRQNGYYPASINKLYSITGERDSLSVKLCPTHPFSIRSDAYRSMHNSLQGFNIYLSSVESGETHVVEYDKFTDTTLEIPYGKYSFEFRRFSHGPEVGYNDGVQLRGVKRRNDLAYKGKFVFREGHNSLYRMSYSEEGSLSILDIDYMLNSPSLVHLDDGKSYFKLGEIGFLSFPIWPGFSTSLLRGKMYKTESSVESTPYLFSGSLIFLNGEQRIGGSLLHYLDINFLASYSFLPKLHTLNISPFDGMDFSYVSGKDLFFGLEIGSRFPVLNASFKVGYKIQSGEFNIYNKASFSGDHYHCYPFDFKGIIASVGVSLGGKNSKGNETLRVFYY